MNLAFSEFSQLTSLKIGNSKIIYLGGCKLGSFAIENIGKLVNLSELSLCKLN